MGIVSFGLTTPHLPQIGSTRVTATQIGSLSSVVEKKGEAAKDWTFETGVTGLVFRTGNPNNRIHVAYEQAELESISDTVPSGRMCAQHELGLIGIATPTPRNEATGAIEKRNFFFCVTTSAGVRAADIVFIEKYQAVAG